MERGEFKGKAKTVLGLVDGDELGFTLMHEHTLFDFRNYFTENPWESLPTDPREKELAYQPITLDNLHWARYHKMSCLDNLVSGDEELVIGEVMRFKEAGGNTIVDVTPNHVGRNPTGLVNVAKASGLNVIMGTAYYIEQLFSPEMGMDSKTDEDIANEFVRDITTGVGDTGICAGIIGEIGCSWPLGNKERKVLRGAAIAQKQTGAAISIHPGFDENAPFEIIKVLTNAGADLSRVIIGHISLTFPIPARKACSKLAEMGCYLQYDNFGMDGTYPLPDARYYVNDPIRVNEIIELIADGHLNNILISQDVWCKILLSSYGGGGYTHIQKMIIPLMRQRGLTEEQIHTITVENPKRALTFV